MVNGSRTALISGLDLVLEPLSVAHAAEMVPVLASPELYEFTGGTPPSESDLVERYAFQLAGPGGDGEAWHNWIVRSTTGSALGFVQATVVGLRADVAWVIGTRWQGHGFAKRAATLMCGQLRRDGVHRIDAHIHPDHVASARVAAACGLEPTDTTDADGEQVWRWESSPST